MTDSTPPVRWSVTPKVHLVQTPTRPQYRVGQAVLLLPPQGSSTPLPAKVEAIMYPTTTGPAGFQYRLRRRTAFNRDELVAPVLADEADIVRPRYRSGDVVKMWLPRRQRRFGFEGMVGRVGAGAGEYVYEVGLLGLGPVGEKELAGSGGAVEGWGHEGAGASVMWGEADEEFREYMKVGMGTLVSGLEEE